MRIDNLHPHSKPNDRTTLFCFAFWGFREYLCYEKEDIPKERNPKIFFVSWFVMKWCGYSSPIRESH